MNGPQWTACLAKGYNNGKYKWIEILVKGKKTAHKIVSQDTNGMTFINSYVWPVPLPDNNRQKCPVRVLHVNVWCSV